MKGFVKMHPFFKDYFQRLTDLHQDILSALQDLPSEALDWTPSHEIARDTNSINVLVTHICGSERYWIGEIAFDDISGRVRSDEFKAKGMDADILAAKVRQASNYAHLALQKLDFNQITTVKSELQDGRPVTMSWALLHALEHTAIHVGHIQLTKQLWEKKNH
jgi:uncharacterized damage-inducible protein DinB